MTTVKEGYIKTKYTAFTSIPIASNIVDTGRVYDIIIHQKGYY